MTRGRVWPILLAAPVALAALTATLAAARNHSQPRADACSPDGLIHAEVGPAISQHVTGEIHLLEPGARLRDITRLNLPCGFRLDPRGGWNLVATNGTEFRRYDENNPFGFAPAFGFAEPQAASYTLKYAKIAETDLRASPCQQGAPNAKSALLLCAAFGSRTAFFATSAAGKLAHLGHYAVRDGKVDEDFAVADIAAKVGSLFFLPPPDAPGGTITLILSDDEGTYRAYLDTPKG